MGKTYQFLKEVREAQPGKLTQKDVAIGAGLNVGNYSKKEKGQVATDLDDLEKLAAFYGIPVSGLFQSLEKKSVKPHKNAQNEIEELNQLVVSLCKKIDKKDKEIKKLRIQIEGLSKIE